MMLMWNQSGKEWFRCVCVCVCLCSLAIPLCVLVARHSTTYCHPMANQNSVGIAGTELFDWSTSCGVSGNATTIAATTKGFISFLYADVGIM